MALRLVIHQHMMSSFVLQQIVLRKAVDVLSRRFTLSTVLVNIARVSTSRHATLQPLSNRQLASIARSHATVPSPNEGEETKLPHWVSTPTDRAIFESKSTEDLLNIGSRPLTVQQAGSALTLLAKHAQLENAGLSDVVSHAGFERMCQTMSVNVSAVPQGVAVAALRALLHLGLAGDAYTVQSLENELLWRLRRMTVSKIAALLAAVRDYQRTELERNLYNEALHSLQLRWVEIEQPRDLLSIMLHAQPISPALFGKLEEKALELLERMSVGELHKLVCVLAKHRRRSLPLLRAVSYHVSRRSEPVSVQHAMDFAYACSVLHFNDQQLLQRVCIDLTPEVVNIRQPFVTSSLLTSFGHLKWRHPVLLELFTDFMDKNSSRCREKEFVSYVLTLARLNYKPDGNQTQVLDKVMKLLSLQRLVKKPEVLLDVAWSLATLQKLSEEVIRIVLDPAFYQTLIESDSHSSMNNRRKLMNIEAAARLDMSEEQQSDRPRLPTDFSTEYPTQFTESTSKSTFLHSVMESLQNFSPKGKFMEVNVFHPTGYRIDAELLVDATGKPLLLNDYNNGKPLPLGAKRVALLIWDFTSMTQHTVKLTGANAMAVRHLGKCGYTVAQVPYTQWNERDTVVNKVKFLQDTIKAAVMGRNGPT
ncbi:PREDICTED: protein TBRG4-like [Priapulus caudatus]|uniref:FAST kinase domain-containing protein 4 n=1 Tax=Priapulus caudatus TaxID=37621 RepID=A0ABM1DTT1_PRICU|nr:PREDICTED: protein TBRG4-like [Priapulus caudatus]